ncbi:ThiF family adenylyltransferase [Streptacidiphilus rugosus]|uniref:ThiF family adenylyltransferase n=1 Tax=Streptacidiphilus rugosus TaxID=405783 RepID=UPI001E378590|nr:ThiF family adenylyltransferase [Streptacidiphilus rugosus]
MLTPQSVLSGSSSRTERMMRPCLKPALRRAWRDRETLQFGVGPGHGGLLTAAPAEAEFLDLLDGSRELAELPAEAARLGLRPDRVQELLQGLQACDALDDSNAHRPLLALPAAERARLAPDLAALSLARPGPGAAPAALLARRGARVEVRGAGRVGAAVAALLASAGVGRVRVRDAGRVQPEDASPAGVRPDDAGRLRTDAARAAVRRAAPGLPDDTAGAQRAPDLVVVAPRGLPDPELGLALQQAALPHLYAGVVETTGSVGPLVLPGSSPCGRCLSCHRADADPRWPLLLAQHCSGRPAPGACDSTLAATVAATAALHALIFLDGGAPPSLGGWVDISMVDGSMRRRRLDPHPDCGCCWQAEAE